MTHEPQEITADRQRWIDEVARMTPAQRDGLTQSIMDGAFALGLAVFPQERLKAAHYYHERDPTLLRMMAISELEAREKLQAAQALAQFAFENGAVTTSERRRQGVPTIRYQLLIILPAPPAEPVETVKPGLLSEA